MAQKRLDHLCTRYNDGPWIAWHIAAPLRGGGGAGGRKGAGGGRFSESKAYVASLDRCAGDVFLILPNASARMRAERECGARVAAGCWLMA